MRNDKGTSDYSLGTLPSEWDENNEGIPADHVFVNEKTNAMIAVHSLCDRYQESSLKSLMNQLLVPIEQSEIVSQEQRTLNEREALETFAKGKIDGVAVEMRALVVRKNSCIFDFTLTSKDEISQVDQKAFEKFLEGFDYSGR